MRVSWLDIWTYSLAICWQPGGLTMASYLQDEQFPAPIGLSEGGEATRKQMWQVRQKSECIPPQDPFHVQAAGFSAQALRQGLDEELHDGKIDGKDMDRIITGASPCCAESVHVNPASAAD